MTGKNPEVYGPVTQVFFRPFCYVYDPAGPEAYRRFADFLVSNWMIIGNGHACVLPTDALTDEIRAERNLIYLGLPRADLAMGDAQQISWDASSVSIGDRTYAGAYGYAFAFPEGGRLSAAIGTTAGSEELLYRLYPFTSRFVVPDYMVFGNEGTVAVGFFDGDWSFDATLGQLAQ